MAQARLSLFMGGVAERPHFCAGHSPLFMAAPMPPRSALGNWTPMRASCRPTALLQHERNRTFGSCQPQTAANVPQSDLRTRFSPWSSDCDASCSPLCPLARAQARAAHRALLKEEHGPDSPKRCMAAPTEPPREALPHRATLSAARLLSSSPPLPLLPFPAVSARSAALHHPTEGLGAGRQDRKKRERR